MYLLFVREQSLTSMITTCWSFFFDFHV